MTKLFFHPIALLLIAGLMPAQGLGAPDPTQEIKEIARRVDEQLQEIDRLLLESSKPSADGAKDQKQLLQASRARSESVEQGIDELIQKLNEMKGKCSGGNPSECENPGDKPGQGQREPKNQQGQGQQGQQRNRREGTTPDFVPQTDGEPKNRQDGQQPEVQEQPGQPVGGEQNPAGGENRDAAAQPDHATEQGQPGTGEGEWGNLQPYLNALKNRGSSPKVQDKYRRFWETYVKSRSDSK